MNPDLDLIEKHVAALSEHFDTVQIFVTRYPAPDGQATVNACLGRGNWFARYGQVLEWTLKENTATKLSVSRDE